MNLDTLRDRLDEAVGDVTEAAETAARAHEDAPGSGVEADALDELVAACKARDMLAAHVAVATDKAAQR